MILDRFGKAFPEAPKHVRAIGLHGGTRPLRDDEDVVEFHVVKPTEVLPADHDPPVAR